MLSNDDLSEENREAVEARQRAAQRMRNLIESSCALARIDQGPGSLHWVPCDLAQIARETIDLVKTLARNRRIAIQADLAPAHMEADPDGVAQVISNLLTNAVYYGKEGGEIRISTSQTGDQTICVIEDNGPGIAAEHLPHIFDRFYRVDRARTTQMGRSGLGSRHFQGHHGRPWRRNFRTKRSWLRAQNSPSASPEILKKLRHRDRPPAPADSSTAHRRCPRE